MAKIDPNDRRPPYQQIADDLRAEITAGSLQPGERLSSSRELATRYGVAAMTVHQAIRVLRDEGLVESWQGRGVYVRSESGAPEVDLATQIAELRGQVEALNTEHRAATDNALADIRRQLGVLQAQLIDLYARTGQAYPHEQVDAQRQATPQNRRKSG